MVEVKAPLGRGDQRHQDLSVRDGDLQDRICESLRLGHLLLRLQLIHRAGHVEQRCRDARPAVRVVAAQLAPAHEFVADGLPACRFVRGGVVSASGEDVAAALTREIDRGGRLADWQRDLDAAMPAER